VIGLIDAGGANLGSVRNALARLGADVRLVRDADELRDADSIILPGVGAAGPAMRLLHARGLATALRSADRPMLGICLGMQLLFEASEEQQTECLGLLPGVVRALPTSAGIRVPHIGWNQLDARQPDPLLAGVAPDAQAYFVHGYAAPVTDACIASATHGTTFAAIVRRGSICGTQFHPERSAAVGASILRNFLAFAGANREAA
jgi:glutamine amidotransferase